MSFLIIFTAVIAIFILVLSLIVNLGSSFTLVTFFNHAFLVSILFFIIGSILLIIQSQSFTIFNTNLKKFLTYIRGTNKFENEFEKEEELINKLSVQKKIPIAYPFFISGLLLSVILTIASYIIS